MTPIREAVDVLRSKNAGPYHVTVDIIFREWDDYYRVRDEGIVTREIVAEKYDIPVDAVEEFVYYDPAKAIKATIRRPIHSGGVGDSDVYGMQQYAPLLDVEIPD